MVVVFQIQRVPPTPVELRLPAREGPAQPVQREFARHVVRKEAVGAHALELDHHVDLVRVGLRDIVERALRRDERGLGDGHAVVIGQHVAAELLQILVDVRAVVVKPDALEHREQMIVRQSLFFGDERDDVLPEAVDAQVEPEFQDLLDLGPHERVVHVEIRLLDGEQVQIILLPQIVPLPGFALKMAVPVVGQLSILFRGPPDIIVGVRLDAPPGLLEPFVLVARMVHDQIHDQLHSALVQPVQHGPEGLHAAVFRRDVHVVGDIVPAVRPGRGIQRREPHAVDAQLLQIVQLLQYAPQIADPVAVAVAEAPRPDLIKYLVLKPPCVLHIPFLTIHHWFP